MYERYYQQYLDYMNTLNKGGDFGLRQVPEPSAFVLAGVGLIVLAALQRRPGCGKT